MSYARDFFDILDGDIEESSKSIQMSLLAANQDIPWTQEARRELDEILRKELRYFVQGVLGIFDNVGCTRVPDDVLAYRIKVVPCVEDDAGEIHCGEEVDIRTEEDDYADMWLSYLLDKENE